VSSSESASRVEVLDVLGRVAAANERREASMAIIDVGGLPMGVYFVRVFLGTGEVQTVKVVKE
ncbi:MAG: T9SS type A sorting domain-containing protein, partial [Bacteroidota bacterium]|nr:T9SS type A sorting domain-containing protein [Bacteroidota bacterium]